MPGVMNDLWRDHDPTGRHAADGQRDRGELGRLGGRRQELRGLGRRHRDEPARAAEDKPRQQRQRGLWSAPSPAGELRAARADLAVVAQRLAIGDLDLLAVAYAGGHEPRGVAVERRAGGDDLVAQVGARPEEERFDGAHRQAEPF
jgi:hypothetical protein